jgi:hypothetical protein
MNEQLGGLVCAPVCSAVVLTKFRFRLKLYLGAITTDNLGRGTQIASSQNSSQYKN